MPNWSSNPSAVVWRSGMPMTPALLTSASIALAALDHALGERPHRREVGEVEQLEVDRALGRLLRDPPGRLGGALHAARRGEDARALGRERDHRLQAEPAVPAGDEDEPAGLVRDVVARPGRQGSTSKVDPQGRGA